MHDTVRYTGKFAYTNVTRTQIAKQKKRETFQAISLGKEGLAAKL